MILEDDLKEISKLWKSYRKHQDKNTLWIVPELILKGAKTLEEMRISVDPNAEHPQILDNLKQLCFYSDVFTKGKLSIPDNVANKKIASEILLIAKTNIMETLNSAKSLEIWVKHLKPVWKKEMSKMKIGLLNCYKELEENNLIEKGIADKMENFIK